MSAPKCQQPGCTGTIDEGYCDVCGHAAAGTSSAALTASVTSARGSQSSPSVITTGTGSTPRSRGKSTSRRSSRSSSRSSRKQLGAGLITLPDLPSADPEKAVLVNPVIPEHKRFCPNCDNPLKRETGFCGKCGQKYSFLPSLKPGDLVAGQYEVKGPIAYGGLGWIYLGMDRLLQRYVVLKGLLNTHDVSGAAAAVAERQFLAAVKHPNIVGIYNFVQNGTEGFIVMEYVGGKTLKQLRQERGPLPLAEAIAYIHRILPAFAYLHNAGLVYCDFKPDNVMLERDDVKLIDMGGVRRIDDQQGDIYGTVGYSAPEAGAGPTVASDLFTVARTLAVLLTNIRGFSNENRYTLPPAQDDPLFAEQESLYRFLLKATANDPQDRFEDADEMADQLLGVLREVVAAETKIPRPAASLHFGPDLLSLESGREMDPVLADPQNLPSPVLDAGDPAAAQINSANSVIQIDKRVAALRDVVTRVPASMEAKLRLAVALMDTSQAVEAGQILDALAAEAWDWRVWWYRGRLELLRGQPAAAQEQFDQVYFQLPGELAPKLGLALAAEMGDKQDLAIKMYDLVSRTDPNYVSAAFGLARCRQAKFDRAGTADALLRVPQTSGLYTRAQVLAARSWIRGNVTGEQELFAAVAVAEALPLDDSHRFRLQGEIFRTAIDLLAARKVTQNKSRMVLGEPLEEPRLRRALEKSFRAMAQFATGEERIRLIDAANEVRPFTLF